MKRILGQLLQVSAISCCLLLSQGCGDACVPRTGHCEGSVKHGCGTVGNSPVPEETIRDCSKEGKFCVEFDGNQAICALSPEPAPECTGKKEKAYNGLFCVGNTVARCVNAYALEERVCPETHPCTTLESARGTESGCKALGE